LRKFRVTVSRASPAAREAPGKTTEINGASTRLKLTHGICLMPKSAARAARKFLP
jgi:hypothetical protein